MTSTASVDVPGVPLVSRLSVCCEYDGYRLSSVVVVIMWRLLGVVVWSGSIPPSYVIDGDDVDRGVGSLSTGTNTCCHENRNGRDADMTL